MNNQSPVYSIIGPSGCGKGTQADLLSEKLGIPHISTGQLLRNEYKRGSDDGIEAHKYWSEGEWPPADLLMRIFKKRFDDPDLKNGFILDGTPREAKQVPMLEEVFSQLSLRYEKVFHLDTSMETSISRIMNRVEEAKKEGKPVRADETDKETIKERLESYYKTIDPLLKVLEERGLLEHIDNESPIKKVHQDIMSRITNSLDVRPPSL